MRRETAGVTESLLQAAKEEFLTYGFHDASMRRISAACGVSTNSIYTRFGDKSGLFTAIVQEAADGLMEMYMQSIQKATECPDMDHAIEEGNEGTDQVLAYIYGYKEEFQLLFCIRRGQNMKITLISSRQSRSSITTYLRSSMQMRMRPRMNFLSTYSVEPAGSISTRC